MTLEECLVRLRMMARSSVVELSPTEVADLVVAIGKNIEEERGFEREGCAKVADAYSLYGLDKFDGGAQTKTGDAIARTIRARR